MPNQNQEIPYVSKVNFQLIWSYIRSKFATVVDVDKKVNKEKGKGLSTNDFANADKSKLDGVAAGAQVNVIEEIKLNGVALSPVNKAVNLDLSPYAKGKDLESKVNKVDGMGLSSNDLTDELLAKLQASGTSNFSGNYDDLSGKPNIEAKAIAAFGTSIYAADLAAIKSDYIKRADLTKAVAEAGHITFNIVSALPAVGDPTVIYLRKLADVEDEDAYDEFVYVEGKYEKIGVTRVDLSGYWTKTELRAATNAEIQAILDAE